MLRGEELGEYRWALPRYGDSVVVTVVAFDDCWPHPPNEEGEVVFRTKASLEDVATAVVAGGRAVLNNWGEEGYLKKWVEHPSRPSSWRPSGKGGGCVRRRLTPAS